MKVLYTQSHSPDEFDHDLGTPKSGLWKGGSFGFLEVEDDSHTKSP